MLFRGRPSDEFASLIEKYWLMPGTRDGNDSLLSFLPDVNFALGFGISESGCRILAAGPCTRPVEISVTHSRDFFFIRFRAGRLPRILDIRPADLVDQMEVDLPGVFGKSPGEVRELLGTARDWEARRQALEALLRSARLHPLCQDRRCLQAVERIESLQGRIRVSDLARELGASVRTLERLFLEQIGLTPKSFTRHVRFRHAVDLLRSASCQVSLGHIAQECGFADQTHFINDFKSLSGRLPDVFRKDLRGRTNAPQPCRVSPIRSVGPGLV